VFGFVADLRVGESEWHEPSSGVPLVPETVLCLLRGSSVVTKTIDFHHEVQAVLDALDVAGFEARRLGAYGSAVHFGRGHSGFLATKRLMI
jgi:hypothetical protein